MTTIDNTRNTIGSRDIIERISELSEERSDLVNQIDTVDDTDAHSLPAYEQELVEWDTDYLDELQSLVALADEAGDYAADWEHGEQIIRDSYFRMFAQELAAETGAIDANAKWPNYCVDWDRAARELQMDYTPVDFGGITYWIR